MRKKGLKVVTEAIGSPEARQKPSREVMDSVRTAQLVMESGVVKVMFWVPLKQREDF